MSKIDHLLTEAFEMHGNELWLAPAQCIRIKVGRDWRDLSSEVWAPHETKALLSGLLSEFDRREFFEKGAWVGNIRVMGRMVQLRVLITEQGLAGSFHWRGVEALDWDSWGLPPHTVDVLSRTRGLSLVVGPRVSGKSSLLYLFAQKLSVAAHPVLHYFTDQNLAEVPGRVSSFPVKSLSSAGTVAAADLILADNPDYQHWPRLLEMADSGQQVVVSLTGRDLFSGLERWRKFHEKSGLNGLEGLQLALGTHLVAGVDNPQVPATELLFVTQKIRPALLAGNFQEIETEMRTSGEKTGMRTLNQSLLQLLLRRKIEMRTAFIESQNPDEFDALLKKVGI